MAYFGRPQKFIDSMIVDVNKISQIYVVVFLSLNVSDINDLNSYEVILKLKTLVQPKDYRMRNGLPVAGCVSLLVQTQVKSY